jgi:hypothetical protein
MIVVIQKVAAGRKGVREVFFGFRTNRENATARASTIWMGRLVPDLEDFDFLRFEFARTREESLPVQAGVVGVSAAKAGSETAGVCVAVIGNLDVRIEVAKA